MNSNAIGFMDSGVGGLTVAKEAMKRLPNEKIIYFGDEARLPYGEKTPQQIRLFANQVANFLFKRNIKLLVIACNTATAQALNYLKSKLPIPVIGVIQSGSEVAVESTKNNRIGVIATNGTIKDGAYERSLHSLSSNVYLKTLGCPRFIPMVENGEYHTKEDQLKVNNDLKPLMGTNIDTLILGCTHYPIMRSLIQKAVGPNVQLIDPGIAVIDLVIQVMNNLNLYNYSNNNKANLYYTTGNLDGFQKIAHDWLGQEIKVQHVDVKRLGEIKS